MAARIRLARGGATNEDRYRVVVVDRAARRDGQHIEVIGHYDPGLASPEKKMTLMMERAKYWIGVGAEPSELVRKYFGILGLLPPVDFANRKKQISKEVAKQEATAAKVATPAAA